MVSTIFLRSFTLSYHYLMGIYGKILRCPYSYIIILNKSPVQKRLGDQRGPLNVPGDLVSTAAWL